VSQGWTILNNQHPLTLDLRTVLDKNWRISFYDLGLWINLLDVVHNQLNLFRLSRIHFIDHIDISPAEVSFTWVIAQFVAGPVWIHHDYFQI